MGPTFYALVEKAARDFGEREFLFDGTHRITFARLHDCSLAFARVLRCRGLREGDAFLSFVPNWVEFVVTYAAVTACGAVLVALYPDAVGREVEHAVSLVDPKMASVFTSEQIEELERAGFSGDLFSAQLDDPHCKDILEAAEEGAQDGIGTADDFAPAMTQDVSTVLFTSGSTGLPKAVQCTAFALEYVAREVAYGLRLRESDVYYVPLSWCHVFGLSNGLYGPLINGRRIVTGERYKETRALRIIEQEGCTIQLGVPTMFVRQFKAATAEGRTIPLRCGIVGGSGRSPELVRDYMERFGTRILPSYGMTEMTGGITATDLGATINQRCYSEGMPLHGVEFLITDELNERIGALDSDIQKRFAVPHEVSRGESGQICIKSIGVMGGLYTGGAFASDPDLPHQWFPTGDLGFVDDEGCVHVTGRIRDIIIRGGLNIDPIEVESEYVRLPHISEACLVGYPDAELGERSCLYVVLAAETPADTVSAQPTERPTDPAALRAYAFSRMEKHKVPDRIVILQEMPKLKASNKVDKKTLARMARESAGEQLT